MEKKTKNLILRKARKEDLEDIYNNVWCDENLANNMLWKVNSNIQEAKERLEKTIEYQKDNYAFFVALRENNIPIGFAGILGNSHGIYEETGICISSKFQGRGFGKEVLLALETLVFDKLKGSKFIYGCFRENEISKRLCLSQGFKYLNSKTILREHDKTEHLVDYYYLNKESYTLNHANKIRKTK